MGYLIGTIKIKGSSLGVSAILFIGLLFGALDPRFQIPEIIFIVGLSIYIYSLGLRSGPAFFKSYQKNGLRDFTFIIGMLALSGLIAISMWYVLGFTPAIITGIYTGSTTNTAALAGIIESLTSAETDAAQVAMSELVVGYSFSYPMGVLGSMIAIVIMERLLRISYTDEAQKLKSEYPLDEGLTSLAIKITNNEVDGRSLRDLRKTVDINVRVGRVFQGKDIKLPNSDTQFTIGDIIMVVGSKENIDRAIEYFGERVEHSITTDRTDFDVKRIMVSNSKFAGRSIASLQLSERYHVIITRIKRGDVEMLADGNTIIELGDRIRVMGTRKDLQDLTKLFGDSYEATSRVNLFSFGLGIGLGLLLGSLEFSFGASFSFKLGYAGGPLIVGLVLGALRRTGPIVWTLPYSANITLQQLGLILLLATIGVRSGQGFIQSFSSDGIWIFVAASAISILTAMATLFIGFKWLKMPFSLLMGMVANQPAILDFATNRTKNVIPNFGYTMMLPIALITKILLAQIIFELLSS